MSGESGSLRLGRSLAGHDVGRCYVIVAEDLEYLYLADGVGRSVARPKRKNRRHVQVITKIPTDVRAVFSEDTPLTDITVKRALKLYRQTEQQEDK